MENFSETDVTITVVVVLLEQFTRTAPVNNLRSFYLKAALRNFESTGKPSKVTNNFASCCGQNVFQAVLQ